MNQQLPIGKIFLAGFAFVALHWKKILEISIIPALISVPLLTIMPALMVAAQQMFSGTLSEPPALPDNAGVYLILFFYGYISLSIGLYRLVSLGEQAVSILPISDIGKIVRFIGLSLLVGFVGATPLMLGNLAWLSLIVSFLLVPITLNFINIATGKPLKYRWGLAFPTQMNLFFLQVIVPMLIILLFTYAFKALGLGLEMEWVARVLAFYWSAITLALCYRLIEIDTNHQE
jgi:hypothetical protein